MQKRANARPTVFNTKNAKPRTHHSGKSITRAPNINVATHKLSGMNPARNSAAQGFTNRL